MGFNSGFKGLNKQRLPIQLNGTHVGTVSDLSSITSESVSLSDGKTCRCKAEVLFGYFTGGGEKKSRKLQFR